MQLGLALTAFGWALGLPPEPGTQLGTFRDGPLLTAGQVNPHNPDFAGAILDWRADLKDANLSDCSLAGADLEGVDLTKALLVHANLEGANCRDAILVNADLTGATLRRVNLVRANLTGARLPEGALTDPTVTLGDTVGPDGKVLHPSTPAAAAPIAASASGAAAQAEPVLHVPPRQPPAQAEGEAKDAAPSTQWLPADLQPFFQRRKEPVGTPHFLALPANDRDISKLVAMPKGVAWLHEGAATVQFLRPDGLRIASAGAFRGEAPLDPGEALLDLGEAHGRLWWTTAKGALHITPTKQIAHPTGLLIKSSRFLLPKFMVPRQGSLTLTQDHLWALGPSAKGQNELVLYGIPLQKILKEDLRELRNEDIMRPQTEDHGRLLRVQTGPADELFFTAERGMAVADAEACRATGKGNHFGISIGFAPEREILTRNGAVCFICPQGDTLIHYQRDGQRKIVRGPFRKARLRVGDVAEGPSGHIWFTEPDNQAVCQLDPESGTIRRYPVPGMSPNLIINGHNGLMYFSIDGGSILGAIVADANGLDRPPAKPAPVNAAAGAGEPARPTKKERAQLRKRARKAESKAKAAAASAASAAMPNVAEPSLADSSEEEGFESDASEEAPVRPTSSSAAAASAPMLAPKAPAPAPTPEVALTHILEEHRFGAPNSKGQFLEGMPPERIRTLALESLARRESPLVHNLEGRWETQHTFPEPVGFYLDWRTQTWRATTKLRIVLNADQTAIVTAFPVRPR